MSTKDQDVMQKIVSLCKRRGFVFQSSEIYGGLRSAYDYGPLGVELKRNLMNAWWRDMVHRREDVVGLDASIIMHPKVWHASGHLAGFSDPLVDCLVCKERFRADKAMETHATTEGQALILGEADQPGVQGLTGLVDGLVEGDPAGRQPRHGRDGRHGGNGRHRRGRVSRLARR